MKKCKNIEKALEEAEKEIDNPNTKYYSHDEVFENLKKIIMEANNAKRNSIK